MKKFIIKTAIITFPFYLSFFVYFFYVEPNLSGDLGQLAKIPFGKEYNENIEQNYPKELKMNSYTSKDTNTYEVMTVGDSFTPTSTNSYVNYLAHYLNMPIANLPRNRDFAPEQVAVSLLKKGFFSSKQTKVLIVESVERYFLYGLIYLDFDALLGVEDVLNLETSSKKTPSFKQKKNYLSELSSWYRLSLGYDNPVCKANLTDSFFSIRNKKLYFYKDDFLSSTISDDEIDVAKRNLRKLDSLFQANDIHLIYLIASDKYDLYQDYIVNNSYPNINVLEKFQEFEQSSCFFNTQTILEPMVKNKIQDVYLANDTHWSYVATQEVAKELCRRIAPLLKK